MKMLTQARAHELFEYDPELGTFKRLIRVSNAMPGAPAGTVHKATGYTQIRADGRLYLAHRVAFLMMNGRFPEHEVDHINGDRSDNRWANLREVTRTENSRNHALDARNKSGVYGVCWRETHSKWEAVISAGGKRMRLGMHDDFFEAVCARKSAEVRHQFHDNHGRKQTPMSYADLQAERDALLAERDRLRDALEQIENATWSSSETATDFAISQAKGFLIGKMKRIASAALQGAQP
ncbi:endonuclease [Pseudomonas phage PS-1]|uniref:HNH endonuclease n=1 Tax=Pseudomonas phage PS-1 TaxID=1573458 RepID=UPI00065C2DA7|nr:HNH endonuclease [Pseudomonas phage PS-1]BAR92356.1 endonuclease [Pseudomonas phage PS-1]